LSQCGSRLLPHAKPTLFLPEKSDNIPLQGLVTSVQGESIPGLSSNNNNQLLEVSIPDEDLCDLKRSASTSTAETQTSQVCSANTPRKNKLRRNILKLQRSTKLLHSKISNKVEPDVTTEEFKKLCERFLPENIVDIVKAQVALKDRPPTTRRYTEEYKQFALKLYFISPKAYKLLQKVLFCQILPNRSLQRITQNMDFKVGFNGFVFKAFQLKLNSLAEAERCCTICIDEMSIKSALFYSLPRDVIIGFHNEGDGNTFLPAQSVLARGIYKKCKQLLCYFLTNTTCKGEKLKSIVLHCIEKLHLELGADVKAVVSGQGTNFRELVKIS
jgi:hypothetical protein